MATVFKRNGKGPWVIQYFDASGKRRECSARTTDRKTADRVAAKLEADVALERAGVVDARQAKLATENRRPLTEHQAAYFEYLEGVGRAAHTMGDKRFVLPMAFKAIGATRLSDISAEAIGRFLGQQRASGKAPRSVNHYREILRAFANWCAKTGRLTSNPLHNVPKFDETRDRRRVRRALTEDELRRLMDVAAARGRKAWYLMALWGGLRRSELVKITWGDIDLERNLLTIRVGKAHREDVVPLHPELMSELRRIRPSNAQPKDRIFPEEVTNKTRRLDFERAGIPLVDEHDRHADMHALRSTLGTMLARSGVTPQVGRQIMRHSDYRTTLQHYTRLELVDAEGAISKMSSVASGRASEGPGGGSNPQQIPQQSEHDAVPSAAMSCVEPEGDEPTGGRRKSMKSRILRAPVRSHATRDDDARLELAMAEPGLGNRRSILI